MYSDTLLPEERFLQYIDCESTTGVAITEKILNALRTHDLDIQKCRGLNFDGAANMSGKLSGCASRIKEICPAAEYIHCSSHELNLSQCKSCTVDCVQCLIESLKLCSSSIFPNIECIFSLLLTKGVSSAGVERTKNSVLSYIKNEFRSSMTQDRLNSLLLLFVHKDNDLDLDKIVDIYASRNKHKMTVVDPL